MNYASKNELNNELLSHALAGSLTWLPSSMSRYGRLPPAPSVMMNFSGTGGFLNLMNANIQAALFRIFISIQMRGNPFD